MKYLAVAVATALVALGGWSSSSADAAAVLHFRHNLDLVTSPAASQVGAGRPSFSAGSNNADDASAAEPAGGHLDKRSKHGKKGDSSSSSSDSPATGGTFSGTGTFFTPSKEGGSEGACNINNADNAPIVALNSEQYGDMSGKSSWCGKKVKITVGSKSATATITDACPECKFGDLDMTPAVFKQLGNLDIGELDIKWQVV